MKFKHHVSNSDKNEDPLKNEKRSLDKALMTGQQKNGTNMYSTRSPLYSTKRRRKRDHPYEKQVSKTTKKNKNLQKGSYPHEDHTYGQRKMSKETNDLSKPFQREKDTEERRKTIKKLLRAL